MKWFIVIIGLVNNQPTLVVEDRFPFVTPQLCERSLAATRTKYAAEVTHGNIAQPNPVRLYCAMNGIAGDAILGGTQ